MYKLSFVGSFIVAMGLLTGCETLDFGGGTQEPDPMPEVQPVPESPPPTAVSPSKPELDPDTYQEINRYQVAKLSRENRRLQEALERAEQALVADDATVGYTSADAISALAEAQVQAQGAVQGVEWRRDEVERAQKQLEIAKQHIDARNYSAAMYFVSQANQRMDDVLKEASLVRDNPAVLYVKGKRVNIRSGPSTSDAVITVLTLNTPVLYERQYDSWRLVRTTDGFLGWIHAPLLATRPAR